MRYIFEVHRENCLLPQTVVQRGPRRILLRHVGLDSPQVLLLASDGRTMMLYIENGSVPTGLVCGEQVVPDCHQFNPDKLDEFDGCFLASCCCLPD